MKINGKVNLLQKYILNLYFLGICRSSSLTDQSKVAAGVLYIHFVDKSRGEYRICGLESIPHRYFFEYELIQFIKIIDKLKLNREY